MIVIDIKESFEASLMSGGVLRFEKGKRYVTSDAIAEQLRRMSPQGVGDAENFDQNYYREYNGEDLTDKTFMCWRTGGIGDILFMLPAIKLLKQKYPSCKIITASAPPNNLLFDNNPYIEEHHTMPFDFELAQKAHYHLTFQQIIEENPRARDIPAFDLFLEKFKFDPNRIPDMAKVPEVFLSSDENKNADYFIIQNNIADKYKIGFQLRASSPLRTFPMRRTIDIIEELLKDENNAVIMFGNPLEKELHEKIIKDIGSTNGILLSSAVSGFNLRQSIAVTSKLDLVVGPDSSLMHMAGAFCIPVVGFYGPFPSSVRLPYYFRAIGLDAGVACSPCFTHGNSPCFKSVNSQDSPCFSVVTDRSIYEAINLQKFAKTGMELKSSKITRHNEFEKVIDFFAPYMNGSGVDIGSGKEREFHKKYNIDRIDFNTLYRPTYVCDVHDMGGIGRDRYDYAILSFLLNGVRDWRLALMETVGVVKEGGYILIALPKAGVYPDPNEETFKMLGHATNISIQDLKTALGDNYEFVMNSEISTETISKDNFDYGALDKNTYHTLCIIKILNKKE